MKTSRTFVLALITVLAWAGIAQSQKWTPLNTPPSFPVGAIALLTDGTVLLHEEQDSNPQNWFKLTPDNTGSYINGTITQIASLPKINGTQYGPFYFGSVVLPDGRYIIEGGEYNMGQADWTTMGAIYDPVKNKWTAVKPPTGWTAIGDSPSAVLPDGTYLQSDCCDSPPNAALFDAKNLTWTSTGSGKFDVYDEEGITLLPDGNLLTVDAYVFQNDPTGKNSEIYNTSSGSWSTAGNTPEALWGANSHEEGPDIMMPDGTVFCTGANDSGSGHTAIYDTSSGTWSKGPDFPNGLDIADGPGALEINGKAILMASPGTFETPSTFFEWDGSSLTQISGPPNASSDSSFYGHFLELPSGQILFADFSSDLEVFTPKGTYQKSWRPSITHVPATLTHGKTYTLKGKQLNGMSQGAAYGDDFQDASNYPLVRITNTASGHVVYAKTHSFSTMGIQTGSAVVSTKFDVPASIETGPSTLVVVANGIPSKAKSVTIN